MRNIAVKVAPVFSLRWTACRQAALYYNVVRHE